MKQYLDLLHTIQEKGFVKADRTGTGTMSIFGHQMRFDLQEGFPLVTTKKCHLRSIIHELLWFLQGDTNIKYLHENNVTIWDEWRAPYVAYKNNVVKISRKLVDYVPFDWENADLSLRGFDDIVDRRLADTWRKMMSRCYNKNAHNYRFYGAKGASVAKEWHDVRQFVEDAKKIHNWFYKRNSWNDFELDKDYFGANQYGFDTCVWLHRNDNTHSVWLRISNNKGDEYVVRTYKAAAALTGVSKSSLHRFVTQGFPGVLKGNNRALGVNNWMIRPADTREFIYRNELTSDSELGPVYGHQWREWTDIKLVSVGNVVEQQRKIKQGYERLGFMQTKDGGMIVFRKHHDQISAVMDQLKNDPDSRRIIVSAWNVAELDKMALAPCHAFFQFYTRELTLRERTEVAYSRDNIPREEWEYYDGYDHNVVHKKFDDLGIPKRVLSCQLMQRSCDVFLGLPFNIASYALLVEMMAHQLNMIPGDFVWTGGDVHLYDNHQEQAQLQLTREPLPLPRLKFKRKPDSIFDYKFEDIELVNYQSHDPIKAPVAI